MAIEITGSWDELVSRPEFRGHQVKVTIIDQFPAVPETDEWLESLYRMVGGGVKVVKSADDSRESIYDGAE